MRLAIATHSPQPDGARARGQIVRAEPFELIELRVSVLLGEEDDGD